MPEFTRVEYSFAGEKFTSDMAGARGVLTGLVISMMDYGWLLQSTWEDSLNDDGQIAYVLIKHSTTNLRVCLALNVSSCPESFRSMCLPARTGTDECGEAHAGQYAGGLMCSVIPALCDENFEFTFDAANQCTGIRKPYQATPFVGTVGARNRFPKSFLDINRKDEWYSYIVISDGYTIYGFSHKMSDGDKLRGFVCGHLLNDLLYAERDTSFASRYMAVRLSLETDENMPIITDCGIGADTEPALPLHNKFGVAAAACMTANYSTSVWVPCHLHTDTYYISLRTYIPSVLGKDRFSKIAVFAGYSEEDSDPYEFRIVYGDTLKGYIDTSRLVLTTPNARPIGTLYNNGNMCAIGGGLLAGYKRGSELIPVRGAE